LIIYFKGPFGSLFAGHILCQRPPSLHFQFSSNGLIW